MASQLNLEDRARISQLWHGGASRAEIARQLGRHRSTIGRELSRNSEGATYWAHVAQRKTEARRQQRPHKVDDADVNMYVRSRLVRGWSPDQIAGRSRRDFRGRRRQVSHATIYRWIARDPHRTHWQSFLRFGHRRKEPEKRGRLPARVEIAGRPEIVNRRARFGDWEGDTVVSRGRRGGLVTLVERKSGYALVAKVQRLRSQNVGRAIRRQVAPLPRGLRRTATFDNGKEFAGHRWITKHTQLDVYFAEPYHAWQRGSNEHFNGLLRQYFPKGTDFTDISPLEVKRVLDLLNERPRKRLGYRTPREVLARHFPVALQM